MENTFERKSASTWFPWVVCGLGALFYVYEYLLRLAPNVMTSELMQWFSINSADLGNLVAFYYYAYAPAQLLVGVLMDHYGPRRLLTFACLICAVGSYMFSSSQNLVTVGFGRFLMGFGSAFAFVGVLKLATIWLPPNRFALISGMTSALGTIGAMAGEIILSRLVESAGWQWSMVSLAGLGIVLSIILLLFIRDGSKEAADLDATSALDFMSILKSLGTILSNPQIWINGFIGCLMYLPTTTFAELWGNPYFQATRGFSSNEAALAISAIFLGFTVGAPINGLVSDRIKKRRLLLFTGSLSAAAVVTVIFYLPGIPQMGLLALLFLFSFLYSSQVIVFAVGRESSPSNAAATAIAVTNGLVMLGGVVFQPVVGILLEWKWSGLISDSIHVYSTSDYQFAMMLIPIALLVSAGLALFFLKETNCKVLEE